MDIKTFRSHLGINGKAGKSISMDLRPKYCRKVSAYNHANGTSFFLHFERLGESLMYRMKKITTGGKAGKAVWIYKEGDIAPEPIIRTLTEQTDVGQQLRFSFG